jgi:ferredoxin
MPWIDDTRCTGCGICIDECPVGAIEMEEDTAHILMDDCVRCAVCHDVCPQEAVMHDSEKVNERIENNIELTKRNITACIKHFGKEEEGEKCLNRMIKHFIREKNIAEKTVEALEELKQSSS